MTSARRREAIVKMATDAGFAERVRTEPDSVAQEYGLDPSDMAVLEALREDAGGEAAVLDPRLSKSALFFGSGGAHAVSHSHVAGFVCNGHVSGFVCNEHVSGLVGNGHASGLVCDGHAAGPHELEPGTFRDPASG